MRHFARLFLLVGEILGFITMLWLGWQENFGPAIYLGVLILIAEVAAVPRLYNWRAK